MARRGGSFGILVLVVVLACVLLLVARAWREIAPSAIDVSQPATAASDHGESEAAQALRDGNLPDLHDMRGETSEHSQQVQDALAETE